MAPADTRTRLMVIGVHVKSEAYPNTLFRLRDLAISDRFRYSEINLALWNENTQHRHGISRLTRNLLRAVFAHLVVLGKYLRSDRPDVSYVPYPAVFVLLLLRALPRTLQPPRIVADAFISLYDTIVMDRRLLRRDGMPAKALRWLEQRALEFADHVVVDTPQNARFMSDLLALPAAKISAIPLATDEAHFRQLPYEPSAGTCRVLFVGTIAPLHGVMTILEAARLLAAHADIQFRLIGDGQESPTVEAWLKTNRVNVSWERQWQSSAQIADAIARSDICLGIFGAGEKAQRVCPYKIYAYASVGRAVVTGDTEWTRTAFGSEVRGVFSCVPTDDPLSLAQRIAELAEDAELRLRLATNARRFYEAELSNRKGLAIIEALLAEVSATPSAA